MCDSLLRVQPEGWVSCMNTKNIPPYEISSHPIHPRVAGRHFGAKPIVGSRYRTQPDEPWNKEFWGRTEEEAIAAAELAIEKWIKGRGKPDNSINITLSRQNGK